MKFLLSTLYLAGSIAAQGSVPKIPGCGEGGANYIGYNVDINPVVCEDHAGHFYCDKQGVRVHQDGGVVVVDAGDKDTLLDIKCGDRDILFHCTALHSGETTCTEGIKQVIVYDIKP